MRAEAFPKEDRGIMACDFTEEHLNSQLSAVVLRSLIYYVSFCLEP